jgi:uncharacterized RDD family membrane protein YckC
MFTCPKCQTPFEAGTKYCSGCGLNLESEFLINPVCPKCRNHYPDGTKYCDTDGSRLTTEDKLIPKCVRCGTEYAEGIRFCPVDGGAVIAEAFRQYQQQSPDISFTASGSLQVYPKANMGSRFVAMLLDGLIGFALAIPAIICLVVGIVMAASNGYTYDESGNSYRNPISAGFIGFIILGVFLMILPAIYGFIKDGLGKGQSIGKKVMGLMVVHLDDNTPCTKGRSALRQLISTLINIVPYLNFLTMWIEPIMVLATDDGRKAADFAAHTQVIELQHYKSNQL